MRYIIVVILFGLGSPLFAQSGFADTVKEYYRVDPFYGTFSSFVNALSQDSALLDKQIKKQTDTTGYYLRGHYNVFNPFSVNASKVDLLFYESVAKAGDKAVFSFYTYQLTAYFADTELYRKKIRNDYKKLLRKLRKDWYYTEVQSLAGYENVEDGELTSFSNNDNRRSIPPATVSWQTLSKTKHLALTFIVRLKQEQNYAFPVSY